MPRVEKPRIVMQRLIKIARSLPTVSVGREGATGSS